MMMLSPTDSGNYSYVCTRGHEGVAILQQDRFQLLFQIGIHALVDGYPREAVADFTASLERFYEFYFKLTCRLSDIDRGAEERTWSLVSRQSERQLGLFLASYLSLNGTPGPMLSNRQIEFRNDIIHKGRIPTHEEAIKFGEAVSNLVQPIMDDIRSSRVEALHSMEIERIMLAADGRPGTSTISYPTFLTFHHEQKMSLEEAVNLAGLPPWSYR
jgi:hypothetical protein